MSHNPKVNEMAKLCKQEQWIGKEDFDKSNPVYATISNVAVTDKDILLQFTLESGERRQISVWGDNLNALIDKLGDESDLWVKKKITVTFFQDMSGKQIKRISC